MENEKELIKKLKSEYDSPTTPTEMVLSVFLSVLDGAYQSNDLKELKDCLVDFAERKMTEHRQKWIDRQGKN